jgi:tetratricopeptide (TPR) repeat protein
MPEATANVLDNYRAAVTANPNSAEGHSNLGWGYYGQRQYEESIKAFQQALTLDRNMIDAHYGLGLALKESGAGKEAVPEFQAVISLAPQDQNIIRGQMLARLARAHVNRIEVGNWSLDADLVKKAS